MRQWWIDVVETFDEREECQSGHAFSQGYLDEMEITSKGMIHVLEAAPVIALVGDMRKALDWYSDGLSPIGSDVSEYKPGEMRTGKRAREALAKAEAFLG